MVDGSSGVEIERKFLVTRPPADLEEHPSRRLQQAYLAVDPDGASVRLRRDGDQTLMTIKSGSGIQRGEEEFPIDADRFERLWQVTEGRRIDKTRFDLPAGDGLTLEVDVYHGDLDGLVTAEVEASSVAAAIRYRPPDWCRLEVTGDARYGNARLAIDGLPDRAAVSEHALLDGEPLDEGFRQVILAQLDAAADALQGADAEAHGDAVHTARKAFKRARALLRLAHTGLDEQSRLDANVTLRDAGRELAGVRDAAVVVQTLENVQKKADADELTDGALAPLRDVLVARREAEEAASRADDAAVDAVLLRLAEVREQVTGWGLGEEPADALADGFTRLYRRGAKACAAAARSDEPTAALHELRKRAKDLWHAAEFLEVAAPKRFGRLADDAHRLADLIGADHDLAVLASRVDAEAGDLLAPAAREALDAAIAARRTKLQRRALEAAREIYGRKPSRYADRVAELGDGAALPLSP